MPIAPLPTVALTPVAQFPKGYFLENLAVRQDGSVLITAVLQKELWLVPGPDLTAEVEPILVHAFDHLTTGIAEVEPDVFIICVSEAYTTHKSHLARLDLNRWDSGDPVEPEFIFTFTDERVRGLNGCCLLAPGILLIADCFAGLIWRVDLEAGARGASASVWLSDDTMFPDPDSEIAPPPQPGVNGVRCDARHVYYTSTAQKVFMRVAVNPDTHEPDGGAQFVAAIDNADDFCIDDQAGFAYVARHRTNTLTRVPLQPRHGSEVRHIAGDPLDTRLVGPSSAAWGRRDGDVGRVAFVTTDGGTTAAPDGVTRKAALLRVELSDG
ncbi:hypothetical protein [Mycobacterium sp.]|uniref:hypothetical protein n=1 Tax=Mycobacterium sp. TaxID=1785 RepID=UPI003D0B1C34